MTDVSTTWAEVIFRVMWIVDRQLMVYIRLIVAAMMLLAVETQVSGWCVSINWRSTIYMTLKMIAAQVVETSVIVNNSSSFQNYTNPFDHTQQTTVYLHYRPIINVKRVNQ